MIENLNLFIKSSKTFSSLRIVLLLVGLLTGFFLGDIYYQKYSTIYVKYFYDYPEPKIIRTLSSDRDAVKISAANLFHSAKILLPDEIKSKCEFRNLKIDSAKGIYFSISLKLDDYVLVRACENAFSNNLQELVDGEFIKLRTELLEKFGSKNNSSPLKSEITPLVYKANIHANIIVTDTLRPSRYPVVLIAGFLFAALTQLFFYATSFFRKWRH